MNITLNDQFSIGVNEYYSPNFLNLGAWGNYASITGKWTAPLDHLRLQRRRHVHLRRIRPAVARNFRRLLRHHVARFGGSFPNGIPEPSYNTWNIGVGFTYKVFTLDLRYSDTNLSKGDCNAFTSDFTTTHSSPATSPRSIPAVGFGSNWCGATGIVKLSADLTAMTNLK